MGAAWCRHRAERARDPKSPFDRVIVRCVDKFYSVDPNATPVRIPKPTPGGVVTPGTAGASSADVDIAPVHSVHREAGGPTRLAAGAGAWQKASLQVPRQASSTESTPATNTSSAFGAVTGAHLGARTPVPPPRRKRAAKRKVGVTRPPPPPRPGSAPASDQQQQHQPIAHLLSPPKPRPKNTSTVSLPEWRDLERPVAPPQPPRPASASPRPQTLRPPSLSSVSESTIERVETYLRRCRSFGNMPNGELVDKLSSIDADSDGGNDDPWEGVDDYDHAFQPVKGSPPHTPTSRLDGHKRRSGANSPNPANGTSTPPPSSSPLPQNGIVCGRFFVQSTEDEWFNSEYHRDTTTTVTTTKDPEKDLTEVKKELQSIIYDYNRTQKISTSSMEVLPTQPIRSPKKKKISVTSITPPPSPVASDPEDEGTPTVPPTAVINGETTTDSNTHSTLLRLLRECQNIEGALEQMDDNDMPEVHSALNNLRQNNRHLKDTSKQTLRSLDSGLDVRGTLERAQEQLASGEPGTIKNVDSGVDDSDEHPSAERLVAKATSSDVVAPGSASEGGARGAVERRQNQPRREDDDGGSSSGRSSMTPSLSELEAALSDMLEKSAAAGDDDRASPIPPDRMQAAAAAVAAATAAAAAAGATAPEPPLAASTPLESTPAHRGIPKISVTHDNAPSVH